MAGSVTINVGNVVRVKFSMYFKGQLGLCVRHYRCAAITGAGGTQKDAAVQMSTIFGPMLVALMTDTAEYLGCSVKNLSLPLPLPLADIDATNAGPGTAGTAPLPSQTAGLITIRSLESGRANRGRLYMPFPDQADNDPTEGPTAGYLARLDVLAAQLLVDQIAGTGANTSTLYPVVKHAKTLSWVDAQTTLSREGWATQRRRGDFGRKNPREIAL